MGAIALVNFDVVRFIVSSAAELAQGGTPYSLMENMGPSVERWRASDTPQLPSFLRLVSDNQKPISRIDMAESLLEDTEGLLPVVSKAERNLLKSAQQNLETVVARRRATTSSGIFERVANTNADDEEGSDRHLRDAMFLSIGGTLHTANNTLLVLEMTLEGVRRQPTSVLETKIGNETVGQMLGPIEEQTRSVIALVGELKTQIDSMTYVKAEGTNDLKRLLLSGGHLDRIFSRLAKIRLLLGRFQRRISTATGRADLQSHCWKLYEHAGSSIDYIKLTGSLFRGLFEIRRLYEESESADPVTLHAYLRMGMLRSILGKDVDLRRNLDSEPWDVKGPSRAVWQAILNLVSHARQAAGEFGRVEIVTEKVSLSSQAVEELRHHYFTADPRTGDFMRLKVRDEGAGLPSVMLPRVFDVYGSDGRSNGYGMAFMSRVIEDMGGFIGVDSETEGENRGTTFSIYFPKFG